jgi:hypothetical protein
MGIIIGEAVVEVGVLVEIAVEIVVEIAVDTEIEEDMVLVGGMEIEVVTDMTTIVVIVGEEVIVGEDTDLEEVTVIVEDLVGGTVMEEIVAIEEGLEVIGEATEVWIKLQPNALDLTWLNAPFQLKKRKRSLFLNLIQPSLSQSQDRILLVMQPQRILLLD